MQVDTNTRGHQQWFYFRVRGGKKGQEYTFNIMNFIKPCVTGGKGYKMSEYNNDNYEQIEPKINSDR